MVRLVFMTLCFVVGSTLGVFACSCADNSNAIGAMDLQIAERQAKLKFVVGGGRESTSGFTNDPLILAREIREISIVRDRFIQEQTDCRKRCARQLDKSIFDPDTTSPVLIAQCPECEKLYDKMNAADARLSLAIRNLSLFKQDNEQALWEGTKPIAAGPTKQAYDNALQTYAQAYGVYEYLLDRKERACKSATGLPNNRSSYYHPEAFDEEEPPPPTGFEEGDPSLDPDRPILDEDGNEVIVFDGFGNIIPPREVRARARKVEELKAGLETIVGLPADMVQHVGEEIDQLIDLVRSNDIDIPHGMELTEYGECLRWTRLADQHLERFLMPADLALSQAAQRLPGGSAAKFKELLELEKSVRDARAERDAAMDALIDCNAKLCREKPKVTQEFIDEPEVPNVEQGAIDLPVPIAPPAFDPLPIEPLPFEQLPLPVPPKTGPESGSVHIPSLPIPATDNPVLPLETIPPNTNAGEGQITLPFDTSPEALIAQREKAIATGQMRDPDGVCEFDLDDVCFKLGGEEAEQCKIQVSLWRDECRSVRDYAPTRSLGYCYARCDVQATAASNANILQKLVLRVLEQNDPANSSSRVAQLQTNVEMMANAIVELQALEDRLSEKKIQIYTNTETGAIIQHNGPFFEPKPPLIHTGEMAAPLSEIELERRTILSERIERLAKEAAALSTEPAELSVWRQKARAFWQGTSSYSPVACTPDQIDPKLSECRAFCDAQMPIPPDAGGGPSPLDFCKPNGILGLLHQPFSRQWLYPPGHPWQSPGFGR